MPLAPADGISNLMLARSLHIRHLILLARDPETKVIVLISKPPSPDVATQLISAAQAHRQTSHRLFHWLSTTGKKNRQFAFCDQFE